MCFQGITELYNNNSTHSSVDAPKVPHFNRRHLGVRVKEFDGEYPIVPRNEWMLIIKQGTLLTTAWRMAERRNTANVGAILDTHPDGGEIVVSDVSSGRAYFTTANVRWPQSNQMEITRTKSKVTTGQGSDAWRNSLLWRATKPKQQTVFSVWMSKFQGKAHQTDHSRSILGRKGTLNFCSRWTSLLGVRFMSPAHVINVTKIVPEKLIANNNTM